MNDTFITADNIISPLGFTTEENYTAIKKGISGIKKTTSLTPSSEPFFVSRIEDKRLEEKVLVIPNYKKFTKLEQLLILSITDVLLKSRVDVKANDFLIIVSTTKGNIDLLEEKNIGAFPKNRIYLWSLADTLQNYFGTANKPLILSNACISGVNALVCANRFIKAGLYKNILVSGVDLVSPFVVSGFQSFKALSLQPCKPFDKNRDGINLGEGCGSMMLSSNSSDLANTKILGGAISNDANHISGPSRTGDGLSYAINNSLKEATLTAKEIDLLNAHGTATVYNDEMESKAFKQTGLQETPMNSLKGYFGHTLGAAGTIETIISIKAMVENEVLPTLGFQEIGTHENVNISNVLVKKKFILYSKQLRVLEEETERLLFQRLKSLNVKIDMENSPYILSYCRLQNNQAILNDETIFLTENESFPEFYQSALPKSST